MKQKFTNIIYFDIDFYLGTYSKVWSSVTFSWNRYLSVIFVQIISLVLTLLVPSLWIWWAIHCQL